MISSTPSCSSCCGALQLSQQRGSLLILSAKTVVLRAQLRRLPLRRHQRLPHTLQLVSQRGDCCLVRRRLRLKVAHGRS